MVVSQLCTLANNFGQYLPVSLMDFDAFIPPIAPPNFTPDSPALMTSPQVHPLVSSPVLQQFSGHLSKSPTQKENSPSNETAALFKENCSKLSNPFSSSNQALTSRSSNHNSPSCEINDNVISDLDSSKPTPKMPRCIGCQQLILDQFILRVAPDLEWHASCLKCHQCSTLLDEKQTCYLKDGKPYCKLDYMRLFSIRCGKCDLPFEKTDRVMRTFNKVYHVDCFSCNVCFKQLLPGDEYAIRDDLIFCRDDMVDLLTSSSDNSNCMPSLPSENRTSENSSPKPAINKLGVSQPNSNSNSALSLNTSHDLDRDDKIIFSPDEKSSSCKESRSEKRCSKDGSKPTRIRTVLNEKQLHTLRTCYNANPRPDALMREQLVEMTGLSPRVIRVWFQNKRCKDKKRSIAIKQMHQLQAEKNISGLNGVPMVAGSPMRHDPVLDGQYPYPPFSMAHHPHAEMDPAYMMAFDNGGPGSVLSDGLGSPTGSDCSLSLSSD